MVSVVVKVLSDELIHYQVLTSEFRPLVIILLILHEIKVAGNQN